MSGKPADGVEMTTMRVTQAQSDAVQDYVRRHDTVDSASEALDELGVAELDAAEDGMAAMPLAEMVEENRQRITKLRDGMKQLRKSAD